jgi:hypothetical protein
MRPKNVKELFAVLRREFGRQGGGQLPAAKQRPAPVPSARSIPIGTSGGFSMWRILLLAALAAKVMTAGAPSEPRKTKRTEQAPITRVEAAEPSDRFQGAGRAMPPDVFEQVRALLREHPDQRERILADTAWKGWQVDGL